MADVKLEDTPDRVTIECETLKSSSKTVEINGHGISSQRRAFVHEGNDRLSINWDEDYKEGLRVAGVNRIKGSPSGDMEISDVKVIKGAESDHPEYGNGLHMQNVRYIIGAETPISDTSVVEIGVLPTDWTTRLNIAGDIWIQTSPFSFIGVPGFTNWRSLQDIIKDLTDRIAELERKVGG